METTRSLTAADVIKKAESRDFLLQCLRRTKLEPDLLEDVADACELQDPMLTSILLACGTLTPEETSDKLFLMLDEAKLLLQQCKNECLRIGVDFGDGSKFDPSGDAVSEEVMAKTPTTATKAAQAQPSRVSGSGASQNSHVVSNGGTHHHHHETGKKLDTLHAGGSDYVSHAHASASLGGDAKHTHMHQAGATNSLVAALALNTLTDALPDSFLQPNPPIELLATATASPPQPSSSLDNIIPTASTAIAPAPVKPRRIQSAHPALPTSAAAGITPSPASTYSRMLRQQQQQQGASSPSVTASSPQKHTAAHTTPSVSSFSVTSTSMRSSVSKLPAGRPQSASVASPSKSEYTPSYARPTAAHKSRMQGSNEDSVEASSAGGPTSPRRQFESRPAPTPLPPPSPPEPKLIKKPVFAHISASLLRPTAAFLASTRDKKEERDGRLGSSQMFRGTVRGSSNARGSVRLNPSDLDGAKLLRASMSMKEVPSPSYSAPPTSAAVALFAITPEGASRPASSAAVGRKAVPSPAQSSFRTPVSAPPTRRGTREPPLTAAAPFSSQCGAALAEVGDASTPQSNLSRIPSITSGGMVSSAGRSGIPKPPI